MLSSLGYAVPSLNHLDCRDIAVLTFVVEFVFLLGRKAGKEAA